MKIKSINIESFRRFEKLSILDLPPAKLVVLAGPNGSGKSSLFDAFSVWQQAQIGLSWDMTYYERGEVNRGWREQVKVEFHDIPTDPKKCFYLRSAYRNDPDFQMNQMARHGSPTEEVRVRRMIDGDGVVAQNYQRLASNAFEDAFDRMDENSTLKAFRYAAVGEIRAATQRIFPDLTLENFGNPLLEGTFKFTKGANSRFSYKNLSGGEKAAFDLLLDMVVKSRYFDNTVFAIDEPETHMNTRLQGRLLEELYRQLPPNCQLWISTHSIGMMRKARELYTREPGQVAFLDFEGHDYDNAVVLRPVVPNREFWERILQVALDDLADLVAPSEIVLCEGNPTGPLPSKNGAHDARCYSTIFGDEFPDIKFISAGSSKEVAGDRLRFALAFPSLMPGIRMRRLIDRDDHSPADVVIHRKAGIHVLTWRHLESYLYNAEILALLYINYGQLLKFQRLQDVIENEMLESVQRGNPPDDIKSIAPRVYQYIKQDLKLIASGADQMSFARDVLTKLVTPQTLTYKQLRSDLFA